MTIAQLDPSQLSDQEELLGDDRDFTTLTLVKASTGAKREIRAALTGGAVMRTIEGASTVTVPLVDRDDDLLNSRFLTKGVELELDGLWFRFRSFSTAGQQLTLLFEDREISLLRSYPRAGAPHKGFLRRPAKGAGAVSRIEFARMLVAEVKEVPIQFISPVDAKLLDQSLKKRRAARASGFQPGAGITVKGRSATPAQMANIAAVLQVGRNLDSRRKVLVCAVMTITQESSAINLTGGDRDSVGLFQQRASQGWPATRDVVLDAIAFYKEANTVDHSRPNLGHGHLCSWVQRDYTYATAKEGKDFEQWHAEAEHTVTAWGIAGGDSSSDAATMAAIGSAFAVAGDNSGYFTRGGIVNAAGKKRYKREDNWAALQRLASEVDWRCFAVSGAIYFTNDPFLFRSEPRMTISRQSDGVDWIDVDSYDVNAPKAQLSVTARTRRWTAPPGTLTAVEGLGPASGRWLVTTINRDLVGTHAEITLAKPQPILPEDESPEFASTGGFGGTVIAGGTGTGDAVRDRIVQVAEASVERRADFQYAQVRPMPASLYAKPLPVRVDCSSHATLVYKAAGAPDPNQLGYNGSGNTGTLVRGGKWTSHPLPGDLVFYGDDRTYPHHVAIYVGDGFIVNMGSPGEPAKERVTDVGLTLIGYMTYDASPANPGQDAHHHGDDR